MEQIETADVKGDCPMVSPLINSWQLDKKLGSCLLHLYTASLWTDVCFRCSDHDDNNISSRIRVHKIVLAARSPVFQAMFFGPCADLNTEIYLNDCDSETLNLFFIYLYSDQADLNEDIVVGIMGTAHKYQVTDLLKFCSDYLTLILRPDNACNILELALFYEDKALLQAACNFIDDNALDVLKSDGFLELSEKSLAFVLKGDTFFAKETEIFQRSVEWAKRRCVQNELVASGLNIRKVLGDAFYYLRLPIMSTTEFFDSTRGQGYFSFDEFEHIVEHICCKTSMSPLTNYTVERLPRCEVINLDSTEDVCTISAEQSIKFSFELKIDRDTYFQGLTFIKIENTICMANVSIQSMGFKHSCELFSEQDLKVIFPAPVLLKKSDLPYVVAIKINVTYVSMQSASKRVFNYKYVGLENSRTFKGSCKCVNICVRSYSCIQSLLFENFLLRNDNNGSKATCSPL